MQIAIITLLTFVSAMVTAVLGFGAGLILTPLLGLLLPIKQALAISAVIFLVTSGSKVVLFFRNIDWPTWRLGLVLALVGLGVGCAAFLYVDPGAFRRLYGVLLLLFAVQLLWRKDGGAWRLPAAVYPLLGGCVAVLTNGGGPLFFGFCRRRGLDRLGTVGTLAILHFSLNIAKVAFFSGAGVVDPNYFLLLLPAYAAAILGTRLGRSLLVNHLDEMGFSLGVGACMLLMAIDYLY